MIEKPIDIKKFRKKLLDYYGSAMPFFPVATAEVIRVEQMSDEEIIEEAERLNLVE